MSRDVRKIPRLEDFILKSVLGRGTFGKVYLAELKQDLKLYAIKSLRKDILLDRKQIEGTKLEKDILMNISHPFLARMDYFYHTDLRLYFV